MLVIHPINIIQILLTEAEEPDLEARYDKAWRNDHIIGGNDDRLLHSSDGIDMELQIKVNDALDGNKLSNRQRSQIANPGDHPSILRLLCKVPWIVKNWPIQTFMDRVMTRHRFHDFWGNLPTLEDQLRVRSKLNPMSGVPLRAIPSSPLTQLLDEEVVWIMLDRLGIDHPETAGIKKCTCGANMALSSAASAAA